MKPCREKYMREALEEAAKAEALGEVPIGAVIVKDGRVIGRGHNLVETTKDPTAHAEINAIRQAAQTLGGWRLLGCEMYVTIEPCNMCAGALVWSRIDKLFYGARDPKAGACGSLHNIVKDERLNHNLEVEEGLMAEECSLIVKNFFRNLRENNSEEK
jgi:tRNA(adenine34) deaminase